MVNNNDNDNNFKYALLKYELALDKVLNAIKGLKRELELEPGSPQVDRIESRIKSEESIKGKCAKKGIPCTIEDVEQNINDVAGIRIITIFRHEIYDLADRLLAIPGINLVKVKDYIESPKPSGYRGYHLIVSVQVYSRGRTSIVPLEIQIRDVLMDAWSKIEHRKRYKPKTANEPSGSLDASFTRHADILNHFDLEVDASNRQQLKDYGIPESDNSCVAAFPGMIVVDDADEEANPSDSETESGFTDGNDGDSDYESDTYHKPVVM